MCSARSASSVYSAAISTLTLISEVEITWMLMPLLGQGLEHLLRDAGMAAHADADDRNLDDVGIGLQRLEAERLAPLLEHRDARGRDRLRPTVKVMSVVAPSAETFCTIMSTLIALSASGPKIAAATPGRSATRSTVILASSRL